MLLYNYLSFFLCTGAAQARAALLPHAASAAKQTGSPVTKAIRKFTMSTQHQHLFTSS